jgi:anti-anti-sigma factor
MTTQLKPPVPSGTSWVAADDRDTGLHVSIRVYGEIVVISLRGPLDVYTVPTLAGHLTPHRPQTRVTVVNLTQVTLIDSSGFGVIAKLGYSADGTTGPLLGVICPQPHLRRAFDIVALGPRLIVGQDADDLKAMLGPGHRLSPAALRDLRQPPRQPVPPTRTGAVTNGRPAPQRTETAHIRPSYVTAPPKRSTETPPETLVTQFDAARTKDL